MTIICEKLWCYKKHYHTLFSQKGLIYYIDEHIIPCHTNIFFDQKPDYNYIRQQLESILTDNSLTNDKKFVWNIL